MHQQWCPLVYAHLPLMGMCVHGASLAFNTNTHITIMLSSLDHFPEWSRLENNVHSYKLLRLQQRKVSFLNLAFGSSRRREYHSLPFIHVRVLCTCTQTKERINHELLGECTLRVQKLIVFKSWSMYFWPAPKVSVNTANKQQQCSRDVNFANLPDLAWTLVGE
jgi:hypothetical protein